MPQQKNGSDCGVFALKVQITVNIKRIMIMFQMAQYICMNIPVTFTQV